MLINIIGMFSYANVRLLRINKRASYQRKRGREKSH